MNFEDKDIVSGKVSDTRTESGKEGQAVFITVSLNETELEVMITEAEMQQLMEQFI